MDFIHTLLCPTSQQVHITNNMCNVYLSPVQTALVSLFCSVSSCMLVFFLSGDRVQPVSVSGLAGCSDSQEQTGPQLGPAEHGELGGTLPAGPQLPSSPHMYVF